MQTSVDGDRTRSDQGFNLATIHEAVAAAVGDRDCIVTRRADGSAERRRWYSRSRSRSNDHAMLAMPPSNSAGCLRKVGWTSSRVISDS